jgi:hypothetical protein
MRVMPICCQPVLQRNSNQNSGNVMLKGSCINGLMSELPELAEILKAVDVKDPIARNCLTNACNTHKHEHIRQLLSYVASGNEDLMKKYLQIFENSKNIQKYFAV